MCRQLKGKYLPFFGKLPTAWMLAVGWAAFNLVGCTASPQSVTIDPQPTIETIDDRRLTITPAPTVPTPTPQSVTAESPSPNSANADVLFVVATETGAGIWRFDVTVAHPDTGWEDYADGWDALLPNGEVLKRSASDPFTRLLLHPHETEQPFTRSQSGLTVPTDVTTVTIRAHDLVDGWGGQEIVVDLGAASGEGFEVHRLDS